MASYKKLVTFLVISAVLCIALLFSIYQEVKTQTIEELNNRQMVYARLAANGIEESFHHYFHILNSLAHDEHIIHLDAKGMALLKSTQQLFAGEVQGITRLDARGKIVYSFPVVKGTIGADLSRQEHIRNILKSKKPVVSDVFVSAQGFQAIAVHVPVYRNDVFDGTLGLLISFEVLARKYLDNIRIKNEGYAWMISEKGIEIYCPVPGHVGNSVLTNCRDFPDILAMASEMMKGKTGITTYTFDKTGQTVVPNVKKHAVYLPIRIGNTFWSIVVATTEDTVLAPMYHFRNQMISITVILLLVFATFTYLATRTLSITFEEQKRRKIEEDLLKSAEEVHDLYHNAPCGYHSLDAAGTFVRINQTELSWLGYERNELIGRPYSLILAQTSRQRFADAFAHLKNQGMVTNVEYDMIRKDGSVFPVWVTASAVTDKQGRFVMSRSMVLDISDRRDQEERLKESEALYRTALESTSDGIIITDVETGRYLYINQKLLTTLGRSGKQIADGVLDMYVHPDDAGLGRKHFLERKHTGKETSHYEVRVMLPDGAVGMVSITATDITYQGRKAVLSFIQDITEKKRNEQALRESEELYRTALESTSDGVTILQDGKYVYVNQKFLDTMSVSRDAVINQPLGVLAGPEPRQGFDEFLKRHPQEEALPDIHITRIPKADGSFIYLQSSSVDIIYQGKPAILTFVKNITEQKKAEQALRESEELYRKALEATSDGVNILQNGKYVYVNQKFLDTMSMPRDTVINKPLGIMANPEHRQGIQNFLNRHPGKTTQPDVNITRVRIGDGSIIYLHTSSVDTIYQGKPAILTFVKNITEQKKAEQALRESEELYRTALETTSDGVTILQDGRYVYVNQKFLDTMSVSRDAVINQPLGVLAGPEPRQGFDDFLKRHPQEEALPDIHITRIPKADGSFIYLQSSSVDTIYQGKPAILTFVQNITEQKKAEQALRESEELYRTAFEKTHDGISIIQHEKYVFVNRRLLQTLGRKESELLGQPLGVYVHPDDLEKLKQYYSARLEGKPAPANYDIRVIKPDDTIVTLNINAIRTVYYGEPATLSFVTDITERRRAEDALRESEALYRTALETTNDGISILQDGKYVYANQKLLKTIGREETGLIGLPLGAFTHPDDRDMVRQRYEARQRGENPVSNYDLRVLKPDGSVITTNIHSVIITYRGKPATLSFILDITERKQAEEALRESEELYRRALENTSDGISIVQENKYVYVNQKFLQTIGREESEIIHMPLGVFLHPDDSEKVKKNFVARIKGEGAPANYDIRVLKPDGSYITLNIRAIRIDYKGKPATLSFMIDVTERIRAEEALRQSEERYRTIFESIDDDYFETDLRGVFTFLNKSVSWTGIHREDLVGANFAHYLSSETAQRIRAAFNSIYRENKSSRIADCEVIRPDGSIAHMEMSVSLMYDTEGKATGFRGITRNVSDRFKMEEERRKLTEQLYQAQKMEAIGTLAGGIAHDFNNLLMGIQGYTSLMQLETGGTHLYRDQIKAVQALVQSGASLTRQLLGFARAGRYEVVPTDLNDLIGKSIGLFGRTRKEISIFEKYAAGLWTVEVDRGQIEQVLLNMFVNAWQAMPAGGSLYVETANAILDDIQAKLHDVQPGNYVKISVTDTGLGMDEKTRQRIFDPFFTTKEMGRGTGLGLASAYGIIKGHAGVITVYSEKGHGSTFNIYLPASALTVEAEETAEGTIVRGHETILLVDDEEIITEVASRLLEELGYKTLSAHSGEEAIDIYTRKHKEIDLVILDMIMPGMSGSDTFDRLKAVNPAVRTILSSGYSVNGEAKAIMDRGVKLFLQKPYRLHDLARKIREALAD